MHIFNLKFAVIPILVMWPLQPIA